jgi:multiple sugar transport system substrate-binding protein
VDAGKKLTTNYGAPVATYGITMSNDLQLLARLGGTELYDKDAAATGLITSTTYDSPEVNNAVQMVYDMIYKDKVSPTPQLSSALSAGNLDPFRSQKVAMNQDGGWQFWNYKPQIHNFKWAVAATPTFKTNTVTTYTDPWMMSSKSVDPDNSWKFLKYLVSPDGQSAYITATGTPPTRTALIDKWLQDFAAPTGMTVADLTTVTSGALKHGVESWNHLLVGYDELSKAETAAMADVWTAKKSVSDGLKDAKAQVGAVISQIK